MTTCSGGGGASHPATIIRTTPTRSQFAVRSQNMKSSRLGSAAHDNSAEHRAIATCIPTVRHFFRLAAGRRPGRNCRHSPMICGPLGDSLSNSTVRIASSEHVRLRQLVTVATLNPVVMPWQTRLKRMRRARRWDCGVLGEIRRLWHRFRHPHRPHQPPQGFRSCESCYR